MRSRWSQPTPKVASGAAVWGVSSCGIEIRSPRRMSFGKVAKRCFYASENVTHWLNRKPACYYTRNTPFFWLLRCRNVS